MQKLKRLPLLVIIIAIFFALGVSFAKVAGASFFGDLKAVVLGEEDEKDENEEENKDGDEGDNKESEQKRETSKQDREKQREELKNQREQIKNQIENDRETWRESWKLEKDEIRAEALKQKEAWKNMREKFTEERCARIQERIKERTNRFDGKKGRHVGVYANLVNRIQKFINKFKAAGLDTTKIEGDLVTLKSKIEEFKTAYAVYIAKLKGTQTLACGHAEGDFRSQLTDAKVELKIVHEIAADIRKFTRETILADIKALKAQMPKEEEDDDKNKTEESDDSEDEDDDRPAATTTNTDTTGNTAVTTNTATNQ